MKVLYITPKINNEGGVARILSIKLNYLAEKFNHTVHVITQNDGHSNPFFEFSPKLHLHDITLKGNPISFLLHYKKQVEAILKNVNPDIIVLCDFGYKAFLFPYIIKTSKPVIFEAHASRFNEPVNYKKHFLNNVAHNFKYYFRNHSAKKFNQFVALSDQALLEWNVENGIVIPNPLWKNEFSSSTLDKKVVIAAARYSYEKGIDRLLKIWKLVIKKHPDWTLEIYGKTKEGLSYEKLAEELEIINSVKFLSPVKNIEERYNNASIYTMTSRSESFSMVILEAMSCGLPVVAFDCPVGPRALIKNKENGFLIEDGDYFAFANQLIELIENKDLRIKIGSNAKQIKSKYQLDEIMKQWNDLFLSFKE